MKSIVIVTIVSVIDVYKRQPYLEDIKCHIQKNTRMVIVTHSSNVTGEIFDVDSIGKYCKECGILFIDVYKRQKFQFINLDEKEMSKKEFESVLRQVRIDSMIDPKAKDKELLTMLNYLSNKEDLSLIHI